MTPLGTSSNARAFRFGGRAERGSWRFSGSSSPSGWPETEPGGYLDSSKSGVFCFDSAAFSCL